MVIPHVVAEIFEAFKILALEGGPYEYEFHIKLNINRKIFIRVKTPPQILHLLDLIQNLLIRNLKLYKHLPRLLK